jgi:hypothetical protein
MKSCSPYQDLSNEVLMHEIDGEIDEICDESTVKKNIQIQNILHVHK